MARRFVIAMMKHETNTFSPIRTDWRRFGEGGAYFGADPRHAYEGTAMPFRAYLKLAREVGAAVVTPPPAQAMPSAPLPPTPSHTLRPPLHPQRGDGAQLWGGDRRQDLPPRRQGGGRGAGRAHPLAQVRGEGPAGHGRGPAAAAGADAAHGHGRRAVQDADPARSRG